MPKWGSVCHFFDSLMSMQLNHSNRHYLYFLDNLIWDRDIKLWLKISFNDRLTLTIYYFVQFIIAFAFRIWCKFLQEIMWGVHY